MVSLMSSIPFSQLASSIFRRFGLPDHFPNIAIRLHERALIGVIFFEDDSDAVSSVGIRLGSCEIPILFVFLKQAAVATLPCQACFPHPYQRGYQG